MRIEFPETEDIKKLFKDYDLLDNPRDKAIQTVKIRDFFHWYYMKQIRIILAIAGEMQKHYKES
jgi:hypothetical protein